MGKSTRQEAMQRYRVRFIAAMLVYSVAIMGCMTVLKQVEPMWAKVVLALVPVLPILYALREVVRLIPALDELERAVQTEAVVVAAIATCLLTFMWGLLEKAGLPRMPLVMVLPMFCGLYGFAVWRAHARYH
jgi:hypothetical protein